MIDAIQTVEPHDLEQLRQFTERIIVAEKVTGDPALQAELIHNVHQNLDWWLANREHCCHLKYTRDGRIVAVVLVKNFWNLCSLFVTPELHRQGIGRALILAAVQHCRALSERPSIRLNSAPNAVAFYAALGFQPAESTRTLPPGFRAMALRL
ncbi:GNAT family N-acetyltransferase [Collimonas pratensis]|uniref:Acetyltransferase family protein n=1 Tax=Collimonas pratensis TaxID=279113 RepID=A0A127Q2S8_9BURK|nr:GNAT family N-acetyltransferase [Collimonas pratensis]AMP04333.1 acetyltransferase family protein [Collimonas pratensis]AMP15676.1 acetyltransferase family protein [Collimonas pratensis]NKI70009.1 GNAT family N-acetyltransferase [Collimonas pratensis]